MNFGTTWSGLGGLEARGRTFAPPPPGPEQAAQVTERWSAGRTSSLEVRLATSPKEVRQAQRLRFEVFCTELGAAADPMSVLTRRDADAFDAACDHLLVIDHAAQPKPFRRSTAKVVGTYRLLRGAAAEAANGFYSAREFAIAPLLAAERGRTIVELGRSCVLKPYRNRRTIDLLWQGIWSYVETHGAEILFGCASLPGTDPDELALPLSYLHHHHRATADGWDVRANEDRYVSMNRLPEPAIDRRTAFKTLPPLVKAYLRVGATVGDGAVIDRAFGTTDIFVVLPVSRIHARYLDHFGTPGRRRPA